MLNKLIFANLTHRPVRTLLSVLAIAVEVTMILTLVGVSHGTLDSTAARARGVGADIVMRPPNSTVMSSLSSAPISDKYVAWMMQQPHVALATGTAIQSLTFPDSITGLDFAAFNKMSGGFTYLAGGDPAGEDDITVDRYYAQQKHLHVGDTLRLVNHDWKVSGIFEGGKLARICVRLSTLQALMGAPGRVTVIYGKLDDPKLADQVVDDLKAKLPGYPILTMEELTSMYSISNVGMLKDFIGVVIWNCGDRGLHRGLHGDVYGGAGEDAGDRDHQGGGRLFGTGARPAAARDGAAGGSGHRSGHRHDLRDAVADAARRAGQPGAGDGV